jgi:CHASE2 domain
MFTWRAIKNTILCTIMVYVVMGLFYLIPANIEIFNPIGDALADFEITDMIFSKFQDPTLPADTNIVLVNIGDAPPAVIGAELEVIFAQKPKVVGVDVRFNNPVRDNFQDSMLIVALKKKTCPVIFAAKLEGFNDSTNTWDSLWKPLPKFQPYVIPAYANLITEDNSVEGAENFLTCRNMPPKAKVGKDTLLAFSVEVAKVAYPENAAKFENRTNEAEIINFRRNRSLYYSLDIEDVLSGETGINLKDKIVLMGFMGPSFDQENQAVIDKFYTPMNEKYAGKSVKDMFGVIIHANVISMIKDEKYLEVFPKVYDIIIGIVLVLVNVGFFLYINEEKENFYDLISKSTQFVQIILFTFCELLIFHELGYKVDITLAIAAIALSGDVVEIYNGLKPLVSKYLPASWVTQK